MEGVQSADQVKQSYISKMGESLGTVYHALWAETVDLHANWEEFVVLFGTSSERIALLNKAAGHFFGVVQNLMWRETLLHITRLTSAIKSAGRTNLTIQQLPPLIEDLEFRARVQALVNEAVNRAEFAKDWRNRQIAHTDLALATDPSAKPLEFASRKMVNESIEAIEKVLSAMAERFLDTQMGFDVVSMAEGAVHLLQVIDDGLRVREERHARIEAGTFTNDDLAWLSRRGKI